MPKLSRRLRPNDAASASASSSKSPRVVVRVASFLMALVERDEIVARLGGESTKTLAMDKMHNMVAQFFAAAANLDRYAGHIGISIQVYCELYCVEHNMLQVELPHDALNWLLTGPLNL